MYMPTKKYFKKGKKIMYNGSTCDRKSQLSEILTEQLNPRGWYAEDVDLRIMLYIPKIQNRKVQMRVVAMLEE